MTPNNVALGPGSIVGSYRIVKQIGVGGMGEVFEATHPLLPRRVALKVLHCELSQGSGMDSRMIQEASILDGLRHPGIVRVFECGFLGDRRPWIAMELVTGESLATRAPARAEPPASAASPASHPPNDDNRSAELPNNPASLLLMCHRRTSVGSTKL